MSALPTVNIRHNRLDGDVAPFVSIGRSRPDLVQPASLAPRTSAQILADRDAAQAEREALEASRPDLLLNGSADEVVSLDHRIALTKVRQDQAEAQHAAALIAEAKAQAEHKAEQARRNALRKQAMKASAENAKLCDDYLVAARKLSGLLGQIREREQLIAEANRNLPENAELVPPGEPFNGLAGIAASHEETVQEIYDGTDENGKRRYRKHPMTQYRPGRPAEPHRPLSTRAYLPGLGRDAAPIWGVREYINGEAR
ncbi:hypothetical protein [Methylobacterium sp. J-067]|uniref:hypothetical protein n=1 Tax=Methylobacterium sp. J-067 TaxID=2836648 RepID=UPI001FB89CE2|nr:hypothetical protein [Methylobacterium sp. J-067]MCJ2023389.1 hypothetical protein [Methylobacterium sp. J-067]